jgi:hypothetical protein
LVLLLSKEKKSSTWTGLPQYVSLFFYIEKTDFGRNHQTVCRSASEHCSNMLMKSIKWGLACLPVSGWLFGNALILFKNWSQRIEYKKMHYFILADMLTWKTLCSKTDRRG